MAASGTHVVVRANLARLCGNAKVRVPRKGSGYHPDGTIACPLRFSNEAQGVVENPQIVFEILSRGAGRGGRAARRRKNPKGYSRAGIPERRHP